MSDSNNQDYLKVGFNNELQRSDNLVYPLGDQNVNSANPQGPYITGAADNGNVQTMAVNSDGGMGDVWINNFIRSSNWKPKAVGFYIDGLTGHAEFSDVYVVGTIVAASGTIGGFTIGPTNLSASAGGNTTILSSGSTAFSAGPTGSPTVTITQAGIITAVAAVFDGTSTIGGRTGTILASVIDANSQVVTSRFSTAAKTIIDGFSFTPSGALNVSATQTSVLSAASVADTTLNVTSTAGFPASGVAYLQGNTNWMRITYTGVGGTTLTGIPAGGTGSITEASAIGKQVIGGPGILLTPKGLLALNSSGVETITLDGGTGNATFAGTLVAAAGTLGTITAGTISGCTINVPNSVSPLFSVDILGNVQVNSLERNDYHWFTTFEAIDGYGTSTGGTGTITCNPQGMDFTTGIVSGDTSQLQKPMAVGDSSPLTWSKNRKIKTQVQFVDVVNEEVYIVSGDGTFGGTGQKIGFYLTGTTLVGITSDGGTTQQSASTTVGAGSSPTLEAKFISGTSCKFYINGVLFGTNTLHLPTGTSAASDLLDIQIKTNAASSKGLRVCYWDLWQAN